MLTNIRGPYWIPATEILKTYSFFFNESVTETERKKTAAKLLLLSPTTATQQTTLGNICSPDGKIHWP
jgi:hypothetical protein